MSEQLLPYFVTNLSVSRSDALLTAMCRGVQVLVQVDFGQSDRQLHEDGPIRERFIHLLCNLDEEPDATDELEDSMMLPCLAYMQRVEDLFRRRHHSCLQSYFHPETLAFTLKATSRGLEALPSPEEVPLARIFLPRIPQSTKCIMSAIDLGIPCFQASEVTIIREPTTPECDLDDAPRTVEVPGMQGQFFFKAAFEEGSFRRELTALLHIRGISEVDKLHTSRLAGLVRWDNESFIAGLLVEYIPDSKSLDWAAEDANSSDRLRWGRELRKTVELLHGYDIIWGDVKPQNAVIDAASRAWVVDFGGGFSPDWVDAELEDTKEGDLQGLARVEEYLKNFE